MKASKSKVRVGKEINMQEKKNYKKKKKGTSQLELLSATVKQNASKYRKMVPSANQSNHNAKENNSRTNSEFLKTLRKPTTRQNIERKSKDRIIKPKQNIYACKSN